jgi:hypothetical protein
VRSVGNVVERERRLGVVHVQEEGRHPAAHELRLPARPGAEIDRAGPVGADVAIDRRNGVDEERVDRVAGRATLELDHAIVRHREPRPALQSRLVEEATDHHVQPDRYERDAPKDEEPAAGRDHRRLPEQREAAPHQAERNRETIGLAEDLRRIGPAHPEDLLPRDEVRVERAGVRSAGAVVA